MDARGKIVEMRSKGTPTRYQGVFKVDERTHRIRVKVIDPRTGKTKDIQKLLDGVSAREANEKRSELARQLQARHIQAEPKRVRLEDYARSWLSSRLPTLKPSTQVRYAEVLDLHVVPALGELYMDGIAPIDVSTFRDAQSRKVAPATVNGHLRLLKTMFKDAVVDLDLARDPAMRIKGVAQIEPEDHSNTLEADELRRYLAALREVVSEPDWAILTFLAYTGARFGEAGGLRWEDVHEATGTIHIRRSSWGPDPRNVTTPKTGKSRTVPLHRPLAEVLEEHRRRMVEDQASGLGEGWVFPSRTGQLRIPEGVHKAHRKALAAAGIDRRVTVHGLRRTWNNHLRRVATGEVVRAMVGHSSAQMTEHYSDVGLDEKRRAVTRVLRLVSRTGGGTKGGTGTDR